MIMCPADSAGHFYSPIAIKVRKKKMETTITVSGREYEIVLLLGHGKGGYSFLARADSKQFVVKQIHHEPCDYYSFGNKIEAECRDYEKLLASGIRIPRMIPSGHTYVVNAFRAGDDVKTVQQNAGHYSAAFTLDRYAHVTETMRRESADRMQNFFEAL